ncbi:hypothetical protein EIK77_005818 [Talaromyces pinophilus]|nr:hypothetical protein EIK77_005818 [Talaromyces pinophilus]PCG97768.1 Hypothetical protein PENO1_061390 [Penicillium occitanis (nom. inval.)]PCH08220.1 hypothetical protein PENOC_015890 [Penicillium occitanis (nom. inval.)]
MAERPNSKLKLTSKKRKDDATTTSSKDRDTDTSLHLTETSQTLLDDNTTTNTPTTYPRRRAEPHPDFLPTLTHLSKTLLKLVSLTTGKPHPLCPDSVLRYHLLTSSQLDDIARHYHQIWPPVPETYKYPKPIKAWIGTEEEHTIDVEEKRERIGRFIGLRRGVAAPAAAVDAVATGVVEALVGGKDQLTDLNDGDDEGEDEVEEEDVVKVICERIRVQMQKDWEEALELARREEGYSGIVRPTKA